MPQAHAAVNLEGHGRWGPTVTCCMHPGARFPATNRLDLGPDVRPGVGSLTGSAPLGDRVELEVFQSGSYETIRE